MTYGNLSYKVGKMFSFDSKCHVGQELRQFVEAELKNEPMFFNCDPAFAYKNGGPITRAFIDAFPASGLPTVMDSRVHMLMPGWMPAIPGWHHDDVPRTAESGQPDYAAPAYHSTHVLALVGGDLAPTEFAIGRHRLPEIGPGEGNVYKHWHGMVEDQIANGTLNRMVVPSNRLVYFDWQTMHQAVPAVAGGWRWFGRASWSTERKPTNEIRKQVQVYLTAPHEGW